MSAFSERFQGDKFLQLLFVEKAFISSSYRNGSFAEYSILGLHIFVFLHCENPTLTCRASAERSLVRWIRALVCVWLYFSFFALAALRILSFCLTLENLLMNCPGRDLTRLNLTSKLCPYCILKGIYSLGLGIFVISLNMLSTTLTS